MADDESTKTEEVDGSTETVDTSTNDDTQDTDVDLEDIEVSESDISTGEDDDETEESSDTKEDEEATESTEEEQEESEADEDAESTEEDTTEVDRREKAKQAYLDREAKRQEAKEVSQQEYVDEAEDDKDLALRQLQVDAYNNKVESNTNKLSNGIDKAVASIDLFRTGTSTVKEELANSLDDFERMYVQRDSNGDPINVKGDVYQYLQSKADSIRRLTGVGATQQAKDKAKEKSRVMTPPSRTPKTPKVDPDMEAFDEAAKGW